MDKVPRAALAALLCLFLAACGDASGDEEAEASRAGVRETARIVPSASPTPDNDRQATHAGPDDPASSISIKGAIAFPNTRRVVFDTRGTLGVWPWRKVRR